MSALNIRPFNLQDFPAWLSLWNGNNDGVRNEVVTTETWARLIDPAFPVYGLGAEVNGALVGLVHYVLHPTTGSIAMAAYMQDLYVDPAHRRTGIARALVEELAKIAGREKWSRLYWLAEGKNEAAQNLYKTLHKTLGVKLDFTLHVVLPD